MKNVTYITLIETDIDINIDVLFFNARIVTTKNPKAINKSFKQKKDVTFLCISIETEIDDFESVNDATLLARPTELIIFGLLTFFTGETFTPFQKSQGVNFIGKHNLPKKEKFTYEGVSFIKEYAKLLKFLKGSQKSKRNLFYSAIDRWRKARFLEDENESSLAHSDEVTLSYFHILELLSEEYYDEQKRNANSIIDKFATKILEDIFMFEGSRLQSEIPGKKKLIEALFISELGVASKIMFMFKQQNILNNRLKYLISELVKDRNSVAHGRSVYKEKVIFPMPPFFPLISSRSYSNEMLRTLSAVAISNIFGLKLHLKDWKEIQDELNPSIDELNLFIKNKDYNKLTIDEFYQGKINNIIPYTITHYLLNKKLKTETAIPALENLILNFRNIDTEITQIVISAILILDIADTPLKDKAIDLIKVASINRWIPDFKLRDILYHLEFLGHSPKIFRDMLKDKAIY